MADPLEDAVIAAADRLLAAVKAEAEQLRAAGDDEPMGRLLYATVTAWVSEHLDAGALTLRTARPLDRVEDGIVRLSVEISAGRRGHGGADG